VKRFSGGGGLSWQLFQPADYRNDRFFNARILILIFEQLHCFVNETSMLKPGRSLYFCCVDFIRTSPVPGKMKFKTHVMRTIFSAVIIAMATLVSCAQKTQTTNNKIMENNDGRVNNPALPATEVATFANGCFWCTEAIFEELDGVISATSGYSGGNTPNPNYKEVCSGETGHAECLQIIYDPNKISFDELLAVFWETHDPTTLNRQGADVGTQYRSAIFYHNEEQKEKAEKYKAELDKSGAFSKPIVTEITAFTKFYPAEDYHQQYFELNEGNNPYCSIVIRPKLDKFRKVFKDKLKH
jgi:peptide-methionine (S)-S-oxide reductase